MSYSWYVSYEVWAGSTQADPIRKEESTENRNFTWNVMPMYYQALQRVAKDLYDSIQSFSNLTERPTKDLVEPLARMVADMERYPALYKALNPINGWGDYEGALENLRNMRDTCRDHPDGTFRIH